MMESLAQESNPSSSMDRNTDKKQSENIEVTLQALRQLSAEALMTKFLSLPAPSLSEMHGEFNGEYLTSTSRLSDCLWRFTAKSGVMGGRWQGKSFQPLNREIGRGFNQLSRWDMRITKYPMRTCIAPSRYDGQDVFQLRYGHYFSACGVIDVVDEFRKVSDGVYLCVAHSRVTAPLWFVLYGPVGLFDDIDL